MFLNKAQTAENGASFSRDAPKVGALGDACWSIWEPPFGQAGKRLSVTLHPLARTRPLPARRALRSTTSHLAEFAVVMLKEHSEVNG